MAFLQNACPSPDILGRLTLPSDPSLRSPHSRQPAGSPQGLSLCWPQSPQTKPQTASPSRLPHTDAAAYGIHVQNPKASSSHQASHSVIPPLCPKEKMASRFPSLTHFFSVCLLLRSKSPPTLLPHLPRTLLLCGTNSPYGLVRGLPPGFTCLFTVSSRRGGIWTADRGGAQ